ALANRQPRTLSLKELIRHYIDHRINVIERRTRTLLHEAKKKAHIQEGLIFAVCDIDEVIRLIRSSRTREEAIGKLAEKGFRIPEGHRHAEKIPRRLLAEVRRTGEAGAKLSRVQAEAIGAMRLIQLVGLEIERLVGEYAKLVEEIERLEAILADRGVVMRLIKADCAEMRARYATPRRTVIEEGDGDIDLEALIREEEMAVTISHGGWAKRVALATYRSQNRGGRGIIASDAHEDDFIEHLFVASTHDNLLCFTDSGRVFKIKVYEVPEMNRTAKGRSIRNLIELREGERAVEFMPIRDFEKREDYLAFATAHGKIKRSSLRLYQNVNKGGIIAVDLNEGDRLIGVTCTGGSAHLLLGTAEGMSIRFRESDARPMGRGAAGVKGIELGEGDQVVDLVCIDMRDENDPASCVHPEMDLLTITSNGFGKRTSLMEYLVAGEGPSGAVEYRVQSRGGKGRIDIRTNERNGRVVAMKAVTEADDLVCVTQGGMLVRMPVGQISRIGRNTQGVRVVNVRDGDRVVAAAIVKGGSLDAT
ncbi:MAG: DNA gyrase subunit A, partial [Planctomycetes bacterium HGW-Planctomycetes-2]